MPRTLPSQEPPPVMTWAKALPILLLAGVFDAIRLFFQMFWFFGPALGAVLCTVAVTDAVGGTAGSVGGVAAGMLCSAAAGALGYVGFAPIQVFGVIMSMAFGLLGFLALGLLVLLSNARIIKANASALVSFLGGFALAELPFLGAIPAFTITLTRLYRRQIKVEKAAYKKFQQEQQAQQLQMRQQEALLLARQAQAASIEQESALEAQMVEEEIQQQEAGALQMRGGPEEGKEGEGAEEQQGSDEAGAVQFDTLKDALSELNAKQNRTPEETQLLIRAREIMLRVSIDPLETRNPVLFAAFERAHAGQKVYDGSQENRDGFKFINLRQQGQYAANDSYYRATEIPQQQRRQA